MFPFHPFPRSSLLPHLLPTPKLPLPFPALMEAPRVLPQVSERLRTLPATVPLLLQHVLGTLEQEHGPDVLSQALATLEATRSGQRLEWAQGLDDLGSVGVSASCAGSD